MKSETTPSYLGLLLRFKALEHDMRGTLETLGKVEADLRAANATVETYRSELKAVQRKLKDAEMRGYEQERQIEELNPSAYERELAAVSEERAMYRKAYNMLVDSLVARQPSE